MRNICLSRSKFDFQCSLQKFEFDENGSHCRRSRICVRFTTRQKRHLSDRRTVWSCHGYSRQPLSQKVREGRRRLESDPYRKSISHERIKLQWTKPLARLGEISFENFDLVSDLWMNNSTKEADRIKDLALKSDLRTDNERFLSFCLLLLQLESCADT